MRKTFEQDVVNSLDVLRKGGVILYPTDTIWGLGCDATNEEAINKIFKIKQREESKSMIILVSEESDILKYVAAPDLTVFDFISTQEKPTTVIYENAVSLPGNLVQDDGSIAIRIVRDEFCRHLIKRLRKPLVSTSANISGDPSPVTFKDISKRIKGSVDYIVGWRQDDNNPAQPSQILKWNKDGTVKYIRK
ncbi:MAG TPA: L-threonylcarbamoyladenylate synthase [Chitinophagaceae bacterium]